MLLLQQWMVERGLVCVVFMMEHALLLVVLQLLF